MQNDSYQNAQHWPYIQAANYNNWQTVLQAYPHLHNINSPLPQEPNHNVMGVVIRSANDDNVHKGIKYGIWTTTPKNKNKLEQLWQRKLTNGTDTYLFFSVVKSGMFEGVARLRSGYHQEIFPFWWENHTLKFKGYFEIEWVYLKDINNKHFVGLYNSEGEEVTKSKDCDMLDSETTLKMLTLFDKKEAKRNILMDFAFMDDREINYIRKMHELTNYYQSFQMGFNSMDLSQFSLMGHPLNHINQPTVPQNLPPSLMRPEMTAHRDNLGFQMNPVSKKRK